MTSNRYSSTTKLIVAALLAAGLIGIASADDSSMGRFGGDSYAYFNTQTVEKGSSDWRAENPQGISEHQLQAYSGVGEAWNINKPAFTNVASDPTFKQTHPNGLSESELQALSSEGSAWHPAAVKATSTASIENRGKETFVDRAAASFHIAR
jgi:hypothetical protein